jgi:copper chaperone
MKSVLRVCNLNSLQDVNNVRMAISNNEGVVACEINKDKGEVSVVYDNYFVQIEDIIESIEELGYTVI